MSDRLDSTIIAVTPAHNEAAHIKELIESVASQTARPTCWVIVDDGSTDDTWDQINTHGAGLDFVVPVRRDRPPERRLSAKAETVAYAYGLAVERCPDADFVVSMDADIVLPAHAFEFLLTRFEENPRLGVAGGVYEHPVNGEMVVNRISSTHVPGPMQFFRREVFDAVGGYQPLAHGGLDVVSTAHARMLGWDTRPFPELRYQHNRRMGTGGDRHPVAAEFHGGVRDYSLGSSLRFELLKCGGRLLDPPPLVAAGARLSGFLWARSTGVESQVPPEVARFIRSEQMARIAPRRVVRAVGKRLSGRT